MTDQQLRETIERLSRIDYYPPEKRIWLALNIVSTLRARLERTEQERDEATDGYASLTRRMNEQAAELHQLRLDYGARTKELLKALDALGAAGEKENANG